MTVIGCPCAPCARRCPGRRWAAPTPPARPPAPPAAHAGRAAAERTGAGRTGRAGRGRACSPVRPSGANAMVPAARAGGPWDAPHCRRPSFPRTLLRMLQRAFRRHFSAAASALRSELFNTGCSREEFIYLIENMAPFQQHLGIKGMAPRPQPEKLHKGLLRLFFLSRFG